MNDVAISERARGLFAESELPFPPLPEDFAARLKPLGPYAFSTRELQYGPYAMQVLVHEARGESPAEDYAIIGFDGHGINSWAAHYILVRGPLALFMQFAWGGAYTDADRARELIGNGFAFAEFAQEGMSKAVDDKRIGEGERLVISVSDIDESGWGWLRPSEEAEWHAGQNVYAEVDAAIRTLVDPDAEQGVG